MNKHRLDPVLKLVGYCHEFLRGARSQAKGHLHLRRGAARRGYLDVALLMGEEALLFDEAGEFFVSPSQGVQSEASLDDIGVEFEELETLGETVEAVDGAPIAEKEEEERGFDILRRLYGLVQSNSHELECIYGILFMEGLDAKGKPILAPLVTAPVSIKYDADKDAIRIECEHDYARLNLYAISELMPETYPAMEETLCDMAQLALPLDPNSTQGVLRLLKTVGGALEVPNRLLQDSSLLRVLEKQSPMADTGLSGKFRLRSYAALAVIRRGNVFVLDDLEQMAKLGPGAFEGSLLARFVLAEEGFGDNDADRRKSILGEGEILFPFAANESQNEVARAIERHGLIRVQGPPGTGKSQTIANLVCHLVARGKRVLVASHQQKAVEVVQDYLQRLGIDFLPMTLLRGDREATRTLKSRLDGLSAFTFGRSEDDLCRKGQEAETKVAELRQRLLDLEAEIGRSLVFETTPWGATGKKPGELAAEYAGFKDFDKMDEEESVPWGRQAEVVSLLKQSVEINRELKGHRLDLAHLCESVKFPKDEEIEAFLRDLLSIRDAMKEEAKLCPREITAKIKKFPLFPARAVCTAKEVGALGDKLTHQIRLLRSLSVKESGKATIAATVGRNDSACRADIETLDQFLNLVQNLARLEENATGCGDGGVEPSQLAEALELYENGRLKIFSGLFSSFRKSRQIVARALGREHLTRTTDLSPVRALVKARNIRMRLSDLRNRRLSQLPIPEIPAYFDAVAERNLAGVCSVVKAALQVREAGCGLSREIASSLGHKVNPNEFVDPEWVLRAYKQCRVIQRALEAEEVWRKATALVDNWSLSTSGGCLQELAVAVESGDLEKTQNIVSNLELYLPLVPRYRALLSLLEGPLAPWRGSAETWIRRADEKEIAGLYEEIVHQVRARAIKTELSAANRSAPREPAVIMEESREAEEQYRKAAREAGEANLHSQIVEAYTRPEIGNEVRYFAKILQKGKRNYEAFLKLKRSPRTFDAILSVLPCWVATIQDVARIFPLRSGLFDIVIIDEASQCSIPSALPLFVRSQKAIVVGDDKQLPCVEGKFVKRAYNAELINRYSLYETLPRPESFNACETSLFDLAGNFTEKPIFLAEHFRCHPDIIAFSNKRFYDDRLIVLTYGMDHSLGTPTELVVVEKASDDPIARVNRKEAESVIRKLRELTNDRRYEGMNFGVCSPFRNQADLIWDLIIREFSDKEIQERKLISATADGFQGDERDVILYSFRYAPNSSPRIFTLADGIEGQQRMNVAFTRPRQRAICFISHSLENFPPGLVRDFLHHAADPRAPILEGEPWESQFEKDVHAFLESKGLQVRPQVPACGYVLDFVLYGADGQIAALEADGWEVHYPEGRLREEDIQRQRVLERAGWTVFRVHSREFYRDPELALARVLDYLAPDEQELREEEATAKFDLSEAPDTERREEEVTEAKLVELKSISRKQIQQALLSVAPEVGLEIRRDELFRRALPEVGLRRLGKKVRSRFQSTLRELIRKGNFGYRGRDFVWRQETRQMEIFPSPKAPYREKREDSELLKLLLEDKGIINAKDAANFLNRKVSDIKPLLDLLVNEGFVILEGEDNLLRYRWNLKQRPQKIYTNNSQKLP